MKKHDVYLHFKGNSYEFQGIAIPKIDVSLASSLQSDMELVEYVRYHDNTYDIALYKYKGIVFIESIYPHVIYKSVEDGMLWARPVDDYFGYKEDENGQLVKRFTKIEI